MGRARGFVPRARSHLSRSRIRGGELVPQFRVAAGEQEVGLQPVDGVADVVAPGVDDDAVDRAALEQELERVGELDLAPLAGRGAVEAVEDVGG